MTNEEKQQVRMELAKEILSDFAKLLKDKEYYIDYNMIEYYFCKKMGSEVIKWENVS